MVKTAPIVLQQALSCVVCFFIIAASLVAFAIRFSVLDALRLSFDPFISIIVTYFLVLMPAVYISLFVGRIFYRGIIMSLVGVAAFGISNLPRMAL